MRPALRVHHHVLSRLELIAVQFAAFPCGSRSVNVAIPSPTARPDTARSWSLDPSTAIDTANTAVSDESNDQLRKLSPLSLECANTVLIAHQTYGVCRLSSNAAVSPRSRTPDRCHRSSSTSPRNPPPPSRARRPPRVVLSALCFAALQSPPPTALASRHQPPPQPTETASQTVPALAVPCRAFIAIAAAPLTSVSF
jgi:hypothetical protein